MKHLLPRQASSATGGSTSARRKRTRIALAGLLAAGLGAGAMSTNNQASATAIRGNTKWSIILCKFKDVTTTPNTPAFYNQMFTSAGAGLGGLDDYFRDQSNGRVRLTGSEVKGWYTMPYTKATQSTKTRWQRIQDCTATAKSNGYTIPTGNRIVAVTNDSQDAGAAGGQVLLSPGALDVGFAAHEMLHGYGLGHSWSNDPSYQNASWSGKGEYDDPWDEMSAMAHYGWTTARYGTAAVGLNGFHLDKLGWLPKNRVVTHGANGVSTASYTLASLETQSTAGSLMIRVPFDPGDLNHYYTVEYRRKTGWSRGIPGDTVLFHEVKGGTPYLLRQVGTAGRNPVQSISANGVSISITSSGGASAVVKVTSNITSRCVQGYVWRDARPGDTVCVTGATRTQTANDNAVKASRWIQGAYGPHTCVNGYVWREAFSGDDVCVTGATRAQAQADNAAAASRANPARLIAGPNACKTGYVWRDIDQYDYVCVTGATRTQTANDNAVKASRWVQGAYGAHTCTTGYVWRDAFPGDDVCVTGATRSQAAADNAAGPSRVLFPNG